MNQSSRIEFSNGRVLACCFSHRLCSRHHSLDPVQVGSTLCHDLLPRRTLTLVERRKTTVFHDKHGFCRHILPLVPQTARMEQGTHGGPCHVCNRTPCPMKFRRWNFSCRNPLSKNARLIVQWLRHWFRFGFLPFRRTLPCLDIDGSSVLSALLLCRHLHQDISTNGCPSLCKLSKMC